MIRARTVCLGPEQYVQGQNGRTGQNGPEDGRVPGQYRHLRPREKREKIFRDLWHNLKLRQRLDELGSGIKPLLGTWLRR